MTLRTLTRTVYALLGMLYLLVGVGSIALPAGWISPRWMVSDVAGLYAASTPESFLNHLTQELGTLAIAPLLLLVLGLLRWRAPRRRDVAS